MANNNLRKKVISADVTFGTTTTTIGVLPSGSRITDIEALVVTANDAGTSASVEIGISGSVAKYEAGIDVTSTGKIATTVLTPAAPTADETIIATLTEARDQDEFTGPGRFQGTDQHEQRMCGPGVAALAVEIVAKRLRTDTQFSRQ